jgi:hypothetical protein
MRDMRFDPETTDLRKKKRECLRLAFPSHILNDKQLSISKSFACAQGGSEEKEVYEVCI